MSSCGCEANVNPKPIIGGGKKRKTRKTKRNYKKGGYKYKSAKKLKSMKLSRSKSKSRGKSRGGMSLSHYYPLNKDPTSIGRPVPGGKKIKGGATLTGIGGAPFQEGGSTGASGISNLTLSQESNGGGDITRQSITSTSVPMA